MKKCLTPGNIAEMSLLEADEYGDIPVTAYNALMRANITTIGCLIDSVQTANMVQRVKNWRLEPLLNRLGIQICEDHLELPKTDVHVEAQG